MPDCDVCAHFRQFGEDYPKCAIIKCPITLRNEIIGELENELMMSEFNYYVKKEVVEYVRKLKDATP